MAARDAFVPRAIASVVRAWTTHLEGAAASSRLRFPSGQRANRPLIAIETFILYGYGMHRCQVSGSKGKPMERQLLKGFNTRRA